MSTFVRLCRSILLLCSVAAATLSTAHAQQTLRVPQDYGTIQDAINAARTGDTVSVGPGTWFVNLTIDAKEITLISTAGASTTTLDGSHLGPVLKITNTNGIKTVVTGFTIQNGSPLGSFAGSISVGPAGVLIANAAARVTNSIFQKNTGINLGVINGSLILTDSSLSTASALGTGCAAPASNPSTGIYLSGTSTVLASGGSPLPSVLSGNTIFGDGTRCSGIGIQAVTFGQALTLQNNTIRNNAFGVAVQATRNVVFQNLIYDNAAGALSLLAPSAPPNVDPATTFVINNTIVNNLTSPDPAAPSSSDIFLDGTVARTAFINNILVGTTPHPVLNCASASPSLNDTPLILDHNDVYNTTNAQNSLAIGDCFPGLASPLASNGNLHVDPHLTGSTDLHPQFASPVIDAGTDSAPGVIALGVDASTTDFSGNPRVVDTTAIGYANVDMGAYEQQIGNPSFNSTATALTASVYETAAGTITLTASTSSSSPFSGNNRPGGLITFYQDGHSLGQVSLPYQGSASLQVPLTTPGLFSFTASFFPPENFGPSTSTVVYVRVTEAQPLATTTLTIAASPTTQVLNQPVTLTIHLGSAISAGGTTQPGPVPPGALTLSEAGAVLSNLQPDASGLVTYTIPKPTVGTHIYTVTYAGTTTYSAATASTAVSITAPAPTTLSASISPSPAALGQTVTLAATVTSAAAVPTGSVTFTDGATDLGTVPLSVGAASLSLSTLSAGLHTITIAYTPDPAFASGSTTRTVLIGGDATATSLSSAKNPASTTDAVLYTATVSNTSTAAGTAAPAGSVSLSEGNTLLATAPLAPNASGVSVAALPVTLSNAGSHILTATYVPATAASLSSSGILTETITAAPPILTTISATPNPVTIGQTVTLTASVTSAAPLPGGPATVLFSDGVTPLGTVPLGANGTAALAVSTLSLGAHQITAALHTPDFASARSTSSAVTVQVNGLAARLSLIASPSPTALATAPVTLTASLLPTGSLPTAPSLAGTVTFFDGALPLGIAPLSTTAQAMLTTVALAPGPHTLTASFSGSTLFAPVTSPTLSESILLNPTSTQLLAPAHSIAFAPITLAAHITASTTAAPVFTPNCTPACTPVTASFFATSPAGTVLLGTVPVNAAGSATLTLNPAAGLYSLSATFNGSALADRSTSAAAALTVAPAATALTLSANPNPAYQHTAITLTAALTAPGIPAAALTGTITFLEGSTALGTTSIAAAQSFSYAPGSVGPHTLTAVFSGNSSLLGSSATTTVTVLPSDFVLSIKDPTLTIPTTHHATTNITVTTTGALADLIDLSCGNLPADAHCAFSPATQDLTAATTSAGTLTLDTDALLNYARSAPSSGAPLPGTPLPGSPGSTSTLTAILALSLPTTLLAALSSLRRRGQPRSRSTALLNLLTLLFLSAASLALSGCSGLYPPHVAPGTYTVIITGHARSSGVEHSTTLHLVVTP